MLREPEELMERLVVREDLARLRHFAELPIEILDGVIGVDDAPELFGIAEEGGELRPLRLPAFERKIELRPSLSNFLQSFECRVFGRSHVDLPKIPTEILPVTMRHELHRVPDLVDDALLDDCFGENGVDCIRETTQTIDAADENILDAAILDLIEHLHPELGPLGFADPDTEDFLTSFLIDPEKDVRAPIHNLSGVAHFEVQSIEVEYGIHPRQRSHLPLLYEGQDFVGDAAHGLGGDGHLVDIPKVRLDVASRETLGVHRNDFLFHLVLDRLVLAAGERLELGLLGNGQLARSRLLLLGNGCRSSPPPAPAFADMRLRRSRCGDRNSEFLEKGLHVTGRFDSPHLLLEIFERNERVLHG